MTTHLYLREFLFIIAGSFLGYCIGFLAWRRQALRQLTALEVAIRCSSNATMGITGEVIDRLRAENRDLLERLERSNHALEAAVGQLKERPEILP